MNTKGNHLRVTNKLTFLKSKLNLYRANTYINKFEITDIFKIIKKSLFIFYLPNYSLFFSKVLLLSILQLEIVQPIEPVNFKYPLMS